MRRFIAITDGDVIAVEGTDISFAFFSLETKSSLITTNREQPQISRFIEDAALESASSAKRDDAKAFLREFVRELSREISLTTKLIALVLIAASIYWLRAFITNGNFDTARALSSIGLLMIVALFFARFITVGCEWFQMWRSTSWNGLDPAFRNSVLAAITLVLIHTTAQSWLRKVHVENTSSH